MSDRLYIEATGGLDLPSAELPASGRLVLGSGDKADYRVPGPGVAAVHCAIGRVKGGGWAVKDLGSEAGTVVNGKPVGSARLSAGDELELGGVRLLIVDPASRGKKTSSAAQTAASPEPRAPKLAPAAESAAPRERGAGRQPELAGYRIQKPLGRGAMGHVFLAEQTSLGRQVALKVLSPRLASDRSFVQRFRDEARAAAALNHPNVVTVFDVGESSGHHYLSMEYMERGCLETRLASLGPVPWKEALDMLHDAASGLVFAESRGIVHRDIKPANLMVGETGTVKIADLGLAVQQEAGGDGSDTIQGTPHFLAPELIRGGKASASSDLYSLGATAFRILSGKTPYEGADAREILRSAVHDEVPSLHELAPDVPTSLCAVVEQLLAKEPAGRPASARELCEQLQALRSGGALPNIRKRKSWRGGKRSQLGTLVGGTLFVLLAAGGGALQFGLFEPYGLSPLGGKTGPEEAEVADARETTPSATQPGTGDSQGGLDDDIFQTTEVVEDEGPSETDLQLFEVSARNAFLELAMQELTDAERVSALRGLATEFAGTDAAREAEGEALRIEQEQADATAAVQARDQRIAGALQLLATAAALETTSTPLAARLLALDEAQPAPELVGDPEVEAERTRLRGALFAQAIADGRTSLGAAKQLAADGGFEELQSSLAGFLARSTPLPVPEGASPPPLVAELLELRKEASSQLAGLSRAREAFAQRLAREDERAAARELGAADSLLADLRGLDLDSAEARVQRALASQQADAEKQWLGELAESIAAARTVLATVGREAGDGTWRRKTLSDPRGGGNVEARGGDANGLALPGGGGTVRVPWSAWGGQPEALHQLFHARLERDWTSEEQRGIAGLLRLSAVAVALDPLEESMLGGDLLQRELKDIERAFEDALEWGEESGTLQACAAERAAVETLSEAFLAKEAGNVTLAIHSIEQAFQEYKDTLTVRLLSDGEEWSEPQPEPEPEDQPEPSSSAGSSSDAGGDGSAGDAYGGGDPGGDGPGEDEPGASDSGTTTDGSAPGSGEAGAAGESEEAEASGRP